MDIFRHVLDVIPSSIDPRDKTYGTAYTPPDASVVAGFGVTPVPLQAELNSCGPNAATYARVLGIEPPTQLSRLFLWYHARLNEGTLGKNAGIQIRDLLSILLHMGCPPESEEPYDPAQMDNPPTAQELADALPYRIKAYYRQAKPQDARVAIAVQHPLLIGVPIFESTRYTLATENRILLPEAGEVMEGGHCLALGKYYPSPTRPGITTFDGANWWEDSTYFSIDEDVLFACAFDVMSISR